MSSSAKSSVQHGVREPVTVAYYCMATKNEQELLHAQTKADIDKIVRDTLQNHNVQAMCISGLQCHPSGIPYVAKAIDTVQSIVSAAFHEHYSIQPRCFCHGPYLTVVGAQDFEVESASLESICSDHQRTAQVLWCSKLNAPGNEKTVKSGAAQERSSPQSQEFFRVVNTCQRPCTKKPITWPTRTAYLENLMRLCGAAKHGKDESTKYILGGLLGAGENVLTDELRQWQQHSTAIRADERRIQLAFSNAMPSQRKYGDIAIIQGLVARQESTSPLNGEHDVVVVNALLQPSAPEPAAKRRAVQLQAAPAKCPEVTQAVKDDAKVMQKALQRGVEEHCNDTSDAKQQLLMQDILTTLFRERQPTHTMSVHGQQLMPCKDIDAAARLENILQVPLHWRHAYLARMKLPKDFRIVDTHMQDAWNMWRSWWIENAAERWQKQQKRGDQRSMFRSYVRNNMGSVHFMKAIITIGVPTDNDAEALKSLLTTVEQHISHQKKKKIDEAATAMDVAKEKAMELRAKFKRAQHIVDKVQREEDPVPFDSLSRAEKEMYEAFENKRLHVEHDRAQQAYGYGIARSNDIIPKGHSFGNNPSWKPPSVEGPITPGVQVWSLLGM
jgi:hypothetical protein